MLGVGKVIWSPHLRWTDCVSGQGPAHPEKDLVPLGREVDTGVTHKVGCNEQVLSRRVLLSIGPEIVGQGGVAVSAHREKVLS